MAMKTRQTGSIQVTRALLVVGVLLAMLVVPLWFKKDRGAKVEARHKVAQASAPGAAAAAPPATLAVASPPVLPAPRPIGHGLSLALAAADSKLSSDVAQLTCQGEPAPTDQPQGGACNAFRGDTSCRTVLPVLCFKPSSEPSSPGGTPSATLSATQPVMGAVLESLAAASARCQKELGADWRMAELSAEQSVRGLQGLRGVGLTPDTRFWVRVTDQKGNCWDSGG